METEAELRAEVTRLREDVDHLLEMLGEAYYRTTSPPRQRPWLEVEHVQWRPRDSEHVPIEINCSEQGSGIYFYDRNGKIRASLEVSDVGANFRVRNAEGKVVVSLGQSEEGHGLVLVASPEGTPRATMRSTKLGGFVAALQPSGHPAAYLGAPEEGGKIETVNANAASAVSLYADEEGCGVIRAHESSGEMMAALAANSETGLLTSASPDSPFLRHRRSKRGQSGGLPTDNAAPATDFMGSSIDFAALS